MRRWCAVDWLVAGHATFVAVLVVVCAVPQAPLVVAAHATLLAFMWWLPPRGAPWERLQPGESRGLARLRAVARFLRYTYPALLLTPFFEEVALFVNAVAPGHPYWFEAHLIAADRAVFGGTPAIMLSQAGNGVLDAGNPNVRRDGPVAEAAVAKGAGIATAEHLPGARIVRAFNQLNFKVFLSEAHRAGDKVAVPLAGDDKEALTVASRLVTDAGFEPLVVGPLSAGKSFDSSQPIFLKAMTARELRAALKLP